MRQISRVDDDQAHTHAWLVRVQRRNRGHHRYFLDHVLGGSATPWEPATDYQAPLHTLAGLTRTEICRIRKKQNRSGVSGVSRHEALGRTPS